MIFGKYLSGLIGLGFINSDFIYKLFLLIFCFVTKNLRDSMGKFYVYIEVDTNKYKLCKYDIKEMYSYEKSKRPKLPPFNLQSEKEDGQTTFDCSNSEA